MNDQQAAVLLAAVRRSGDALASALHQLKKELSPADFERWSQAVGRSMGTMHEELLEPICQEHPMIVPKALGGSAPEPT